MSENCFFLRQETVFSASENSVFCVRKHYIPRQDNLFLASWKSFLYHTVIGVDAEINGISSKAVGRDTDVDAL